MRILAFDTETTGLCDFKLPKDHSSNGRLLQLGAVLFELDPDGTKTELSVLNILIRPEEGTVMTEGAYNAHGISLTSARDGGVELYTALRLFKELAQCADLLIAYNFDYDLRVLAAEYTRKDYDWRKIFAMAPTHCVMKPMTPICRLAGPRGFKWPKLSEAYMHCFGKVLVGAHDALVDVRATIDVYVWARDNAND